MTISPGRPLDAAVLLRCSHPGCDAALASGGGRYVRIEHNDDGTPPTRRRTEERAVKTTTTTREYDERGNMTRETVVEHEAPAPVVQCSCRYGTTLVYCPLHGNGGNVQPYRVWCGTSTTNVPPTSYTISGPAIVAKAAA